MMGANHVFAQTDVTGYETVTVSIPASAYNADAGGPGKGAPQMAPVKYNKTFPLVITSDDMGKTELTNNWAALNGYPIVNDHVDLGIQPGGTKFLQAPYKKYYMQGESQDVADHLPMTYTDNVGKTQRYRMTSAIMPYLLKSDGSCDYSHIDANDAKLMLRTGWSFAQHDVNDISSVDAIKTAMTTNSTQWASKVGIGLKVMVEPNGNHNYLAAGKQNSGVCWNIFQNSTSEYPDNSKFVNDWTHSRTDWTSTGIGTMPTTFSSKPTGGYIRTFFQGNESAWKSAVDVANGENIIIGGTHGIGDEIKDHLRTSSNIKNNAWVGSADEVWEYYHIYNNLKIENVSWDDTNKKLTFDVQVPTYQKNQYRELTINIPGLEGGSSTPTVSSNVITGGARQNGSQYTLNLGLESRTLDNINELMAIYRDDQTNLFVKRDLEYLISQLWDGTAKTNYQTQLDHPATHDLTIQSSLGTTLATIKTDTDGEKQFAVPRYIVKEDKLYEVTANSTRPNYAKTIMTTSTPSAISYAEKDLASLKVGTYTPKAKLFVEGEDMVGTTIVGADLDLPQTSHSRYWAMALSSGGMGGNLVSGTSATVTSDLPRGKYKAVIGFGESYKSQGNYNYSLMVNGTQVATVSTSSAANNAVTELTTAEFEVSASGQTITLTTDNTNAGSRWIDYIYFVETNSLEPQVPTATLTSNISADMMVNKSATLTATTGLNGGTIVSTTIYAADSDGNKTGDALATSTTETTISYTFTPNAAGTYYFVSESTNSVGTTTSSLLTITVVNAINTYTLRIVDKSGSVALSTTVAAASLTADPLANAYRSPFAKNYKYYNTIAEAQANSGSALATTDDWIQSTVYVGYDVDATKMAKAYAIWANNIWMHVVTNEGKAENPQYKANTFHQSYVTVDQKYDVTNKKGNTVQNGNLAVNTLPIIDNTYMWLLGNDPYYVKLKNKVFGMYNSPTANEAAILYDGSEESSAEVYCLTYWQNRAGTATVTDDYYRLIKRSDGRTVGSNGDKNGSWRAYLTSDLGDNDWNAVTKLYIRELPKVNINILNASDEVEYIMHGYYNTNATSMPQNPTGSYTPYSLSRACTSLHKWYYSYTSETVNDPVSYGSAMDFSKLSANANLYVKYTLDTDKWGTLVKTAETNIINPFTDTSSSYDWYSIYISNLKQYLLADNSSVYPVRVNETGTAPTDATTLGQWAFTGTPYNVRVINRKYGDGIYLGINSTAVNTDYPYLFAPDTENVSTSFEAVNNIGDNSTRMLLRPMGSFNGDYPYLYLGSSYSPTHAAYLDDAGANSRLVFTWIASTDIIRPSKVHLEVSNASTYVDNTVTLTAIVTPDNKDRNIISNLAIEQQVNGEWSQVGTAYAGSNVEGASKNDETGIVTVTYEFTPAAEGTYNFRAHALVDGEAQYSTDAMTAGGDGDAVEIIATVKPLTPYNSTYTLTLIDKDGNELLTEANVPKIRITETNSVSGRNGDPLNNDYRSPLVTTYKYYEGTTEGKASAQAANDDNQIDWNSYEGTTIYVGYTVSDAIDLNGGKFGSLNDGDENGNSLMKNRKERGNGDNTKVRDASKFGKMYLLKFKTSQDYRLEDTKDHVSTEAKKTPSGSIVYPYTNGDGPIYLYNDDIYQDTKDNGASTRTRYPWFLVSLKGDPYHVYITSWQSSHINDAKTKNHYSYLRTYYVNSTIGVVTNNVTDDPTTTDGSNKQLLPTDYMILRGNGTDGNYKLMTTGEVNGSRQTVTSFEQYWRTNPTAQTTVGKEAGTALDGSDKTTLTSSPYNWHEYAAYVNAKPETGGDKTYTNTNHWFMSVNVGDGSFDLVETNIDGVLVLLDNHGWEIMRKPIVDPADPDYASVQTELKKYDSPMVSEYKFYSTRAVKHKVPGYHKYDIVYKTHDDTTPLTTTVATENPVTSLANYPKVYDSGALTDLYVTYEVKDEYKNSYTGAATEEATAASSFLLQQGSNYAKADGTSITSTATVGDADRWKLKPNFNIDAEMGYLYTGGTDGEKSKSDLETLYNTNSRNGFDPYNLQIQNATTSTYFTTNATTAALSTGEWSGNGSTLNLAAVSSHITPTGYDNKTLAVTNATFMAVKDQYGNMRLMPRFQHEKVVDNFATLADPATLDAYTPTNSQTTQVATPVTYHIIDNSGNDALQMTVTEGVGLNLPNALKSPMVSAYQFHSTQEHASAAATRATDDITLPQENVYVSYTVDATKMAATKKYAISSGTSNVFLHFVFRGNEATSSYNNFEYRYRTDQQKYDQEDVGSPTPAVNQFDHSNLPFVDKTYLWTLGDDPYNITITSEAARNWKYLARNPTSSPTGQVIQKKDVEDASKYCLLYWNGDSTSEYSVLRYAGLNAETYVQYDGNNNGKWVDASANNVDNAKLVIEELPEINVNVVNAAGAVEYTLAGRYINTASVPASDKVPFFLQRSYTSRQTYYYTLANAAAKENAITAGTVPVAATMAENMTDSKYNIYVRYDLDANWNTENLFVVSTNESKSYYILNYPANSSTPYLGVDAEKKVIGLSNSISDEAHWAIYGTPYALRLESQANSGYYVGMPENNLSANPQLYNTFDGIISTWELAAYTNSKDAATYKPMPLLRPQGAISRETPLVYLRPNGNAAALADNDADNVRLTFEGAAKVTLAVVDKSGREVISEQVSAATIESTSGNPLSTGLRSPYAKNYKYYATPEEAQANSGTELDQSALISKTEQTVYVGYDVITSENVEEGEAILKTNGTAAYRIRCNANNTQGMHAVFSPGSTGSADNNYGWKMDNQTKDCYNGETVNYNTLPFIDRAWAWEFVSENNDPYNVKIRNKATGQYLGCENNSNKQYQTTFATNDANATIYSLLTYGKNDQGNATQYLAFYVTDATTSQTGYLTYTNNDGGTWRLRSDRNDAATYIRVQELVDPLEIHIVGPAGTSHAGEVEATIHGYRNSGVGANTVPAFVPYFLSRAYTTGQKFYYTKEAAVAAAENTEISSVVDNSITDSYGSDGVKDVFVSYTLDASNWIPSGTDAAKTANTTIIKPFYSGEGKINWYGIRASANNDDFLKAGADLPAAITRTTLDTSNADDVEMKKSEWAFIGTPYSLQLVERYHGMSSHLGVADNAVPNNRAYVYANGAEGSVTTFELLTGLGNTSGKLFLRPQGSLNAQAPYLYLGGNDDNMPLSKGASSTQGIDLTWVKETDAKTLTFTLYDPQGNSMSSDISDYTFTGVSEGDNLAELFAVTGMKRRYCDYTYYSDNTLTRAVTKASSDANETVYVKWDYADDAPVFSTGSEPRDYQYYMMNASNGSASYGMKVKGNSTDGYTLAPNDGLTPVKEGRHQFALVGTPYAFKLYSRYAGMNVKTDNTGNVLVFTDTYNAAGTTEAVFDLPIPVNSAITQSTQMDLRMKNNPNRHIWCDANNIWMNNSTGGYLLLTHLIAPVRVFKEGNTAIDNIVDHQEYALALNIDGTARATTERITDSDLYRSATGNPNYYTNDFRHAFCDYTFYHTYEWSTGALSNAIPSTGEFAGLPYYGGKDNQFARSFFATYTVDDEQFSKIYVLDNANAQTLKFFGCGKKTTMNEKDYFPIVCDKTTLEAARADDTNAYRWYMTGDPYNLQLTCLGTGDNYQNIPLGVQNVHTTLSDEATVENGMLARLTNDTTYAVKSHWEVVQNTDGNHIFYLVDDVSTYDDADRYTYSLGQRVYTSPDLYASSNQIYALRLTPAVAQYNVVWTIMEGSSGSYINVATYTKANVSKGTTLTLEDMPEVLKRHFCEYNNMYSDATCTTAFTNNEATVGDEALNIYVPYTLAAGAPTFYESVEAYDAAGENKDPYLIRLYQNKYVKENDTPDADITDVKNTAAGNSVGKWVLIGSPYKVQLYNVAKENYLYINMGSIAPNASVPVGAADAGNSYWTLLDDKNGDKSAICMWESDNHQMLYLGYNETDVVMNILSDKAQATSAEFVGENGLDGVKMRLHYGDGTLRKSSSNTAMAGLTETFDVYNYFNKGTKLINVMPAKIKRAFCNYTFKYNNEDVTEQDVRDIITNALVNAAKASSELITVDVYYTVNSPFAWSTGTRGYADKHWYYLVNNHIQSNERGKMVYRDANPKLRVSTGLVDSRMYLNNYEWCVIGDPYGFKMLNHYDPDQRYDEYISVTTERDGNDEGYQLEQVSSNSNCLYEMMPGQYSYNFWMHPINTEAQLAEYDADSYSYVGNNYNGSAAIVSDLKHNGKYLNTNSSANFRLEIQSDATLAEYVKYAGFVGGLKYDKTAEELRTAAASGTLTSEQKTAIRALIDNPENIEQMVQGYYRIVPYTQEGGSEHKYIRGYLDEDEKTNSSNMNSNLKVVDQETAEYMPATIFWFEGTTSDDTENGYPRYYVRTQGLSMSGGSLGDEAYKCRYENLGAAIMQLKTSDNSSHEYLSCTGGATETSTNQCFDEQAGYYKTRLYLQKVNNTNDNEMAFKMKLNKGHNGKPILAGNEAYGNLPYTYTSIYVPYDLQVVGGKDKNDYEVTAEDCDMVPFIGVREHYYNKKTEGTDTYYDEDEYALVCHSIDMHQKKSEWADSKLHIPAATPVLFRSKSGMTEVSYTIPTDAPSTDNEELRITENMLEGTYVKKIDTRTNIRIFGKESKVINSTKTYTGRVGLFTRTNTSAKLTNNKIYYIQPDHSAEQQQNANATRAVLFAFEETEENTTGISSIKSTQEDAIYDLQGRKLDQVTKPGLYIINGRKVVIKKEK